MAGPHPKQAPIQHQVSVEFLPEISQFANLEGSSATNSAKLLGSHPWIAIDSADVETFGFKSVGKPMPPKSSAVPKKHRARRMHLRAK
jgi:hypothetical protein